MLTRAYTCMQAHTDMWGSHLHMITTCLRGRAQLLTSALQNSTVAANGMHHIVHNISRHVALLEA